MITNTELKKLVKEVKQDAKLAGLKVPSKIEYRISKKMSRSFGRYTEKRSLNLVTRQYEVSKRIISLSSDLTPEMAKLTLMHEMVHAVAGVKAGHGFEWKLWAKKVNAMFPHYNIQRLASEEECKKIKEIRKTTRKTRLI